MVRHILIWKIRRDVPDPESLLLGAKREIEALTDEIAGVRTIKVMTSPLPSSSADAVIECIFDDIDGLSAYKAHPAHIAVANKYIRPFAESKLSFDISE
ncbi:MAG: Dabb family protein [Clostridia bacterium]|nr:Dabb family protein [Clostridia bacterium]